MNILHPIDMKVFISHSHKDEWLANRIAEVLRKAGLEVWDGREILPGDNWAEKVARALNESNAMVVLFTRDGMKSRSVRQDFEFALGEMRYKERLIPVLVGSPKKGLGRDFPWILKHLRTVKLDGYDSDDEDLAPIADALLEVSPESRTIRN